MGVALSVVIPVLNEADTIGGLLAQLAELGAEEVIVVDGNSSDHTAGVAQRCGARLVRMSPGRAMQMNAGARASGGDAILFLHADVRLGPDSVAAIREALRDPQVAGGNLDILYEGGDFPAACFTRINRIRRRWGIFYGDSGIFCRRAVFEDLGGFKPIPILEDYEFARRLWKGHKLALLDAPIYVSARRWKKGGLLRTLWSWFWIQGLYMAGVSPDRLVRMYRVVR
ncbi:MAG: TIGR04283 family arsenosugar biosynthesis glycosyltransferase [Bryobacteraceae bacterium]